MAELKVGEELMETNNDGMSSDDGIPCYSEEEADVLAAKLANRESFAEAQQVLRTWLERGQCNESNREKFSTLMRLVFEHERKLKLEQIEHLQQMRRTQQQVVYQNYDVYCNMYKFEKSLAAIEDPEIFDSFSPIQKEKIQAMKKDLLDLNQIFFRQCMGIAIEGNGSNDSEFVSNEAKELVLRYLGDSLRLKVIREETAELKAKCEYFKAEISTLKAEIELAAKRSVVDESTEFSDNFVQNQSQLNGLISIFLYQHSDGVNFDDICSYVNTIIPTTDAKEVEIFLRKFPGLFKEVELGYEKKWVYVGFDTESPNME